MCRVEHASRFTFKLPYQIKKLFAEVDKRKNIFSPESLFANIWPNNCNNIRSITRLMLLRQGRDFLTSCSGDNTSILKTNLQRHKAIHTTVQDTARSQHNLQYIFITFSLHQTYKDIFICRVLPCVNSSCF